MAHYAYRRKKRRRTMVSLVHGTPDLKTSVLLRSHGQCAYCGTTLTVRTMTMDHIVPISRGDQTVLENLCAACPTCNHGKGSKVIVNRFYG